MESDPHIQDRVVLAIDAGNTRIKWSVHDGHAWSASGAIATADSKALYESLRPALPVDACIASNVADATVEAQLKVVCDKAKIPFTLIRSVGRQQGVVNGYRDPQQLGSDRWAALIAAHRAAPGDKLVVNAGTALTVDALTADGRFLGGIIVPGLRLMRRALDRGTAGLRLTEGAVCDIAQNTPDAITSGAVHACVGAIERLARAMGERGSPPGRIILSGGGAAEIAGALPLPATHIENLVLEGLLLIARNG